MAKENKILVESYPAAEDLSDNQYRFVVLTAAGTVRRPDSEAEIALGILQNAPIAGEAASVMEIGVSKFHGNAALGIGSFVMPEFVDAADAGKGKDAAGALAYARGFVLEATGAEDDIGSVLLLGMTPAIEAAAIADPGNAGAISVEKTGVCPMTSAGAETRTIAAPTFIGQEISLIDDVHVGNIVVTVSAGVNQTDNNTLTFGAVQDACVLKAMQIAGALRWRITANDGVALSTV